MRESPADCYAEDGFKTISTNPCGEIPLAAGDACRLLSLNLYSYVNNPFTENATFDYEKFVNHAKLSIKLMDNMIELENEKIDKIFDKIYSDPEDDVARLLRKRDNAWKTKVHASIEENFGKSSEKLRNKQEADNPLKLLQKALDALSDIDTTQQTFQEDPQVLECIREIGKIVWEYKKMLE